MFKKKNWSKKAPERTPPRAKVEIDKEYSELCGRAGELQFTGTVIDSQLNQVNARIRELAQEANEREALDKATAKDDSGTEDTKE